MKTRKITWLIALLFLLTNSVGVAATLTVNGNITFGIEAKPASNYPVWVSVLLPDGSRASSNTKTNKDGFYRMQTEINDNFIGADSLLVRIETFDLCLGKVIYNEYAVILGTFQELKSNFQICQGFSSPEIRQNCQAIFFFDQMMFSPPYSVQFHDLSYSAQPVTSWKWDFGDGATSDEPAPMHEYEKPGNYTVTLTIQSAECISRFQSVVVIIDGARCVCPAIYDPVCLTDPQTGTTQTFINACWASCAGVNERELSPCSDCICPLIYAPVCVFTASGKKVFGNACEARCSGYTDDQITSCAPDSSCVCPAIFDPVCAVLSDGSIKRFSNSCEAACEGFFNTFSCDPNGSDCNAAFFVEDLDSLTVLFNDISRDGGSPVIAWRWDFGDDTFSNEPNPLHQYKKEGSYKVSLTIVTESGCTSTHIQQVDIGKSDCICDTEYDPVCVSLGQAVTLTFPNRCEAYCAGFSDADFVDCPNSNGCSCPKNLDPVCVATPSGQILTFPNACFAECEGYLPIHYYSCRPNEDCICPEYYDPVCVVGPDSTIITFSNECFAKCEGYGPDQYITCEEDCICPAIFSPVCVAVDSVTIIRFSNACEAECKGYTAEQFVNCDTVPCFCPEYYDPVCVIGPDGGKITFSNPCFASCEGYWEKDFVSCAIDCICPDVFAPVCVQLPNGTIKSYSNACFAQCDGYSDSDFVPCDLSGCFCPLIFEPVCVLDSSNNILTFPNRCVAKCEGYENYFSCGDRDLECFANFEWDYSDIALTPLPTITFLDRSFSQNTGIVSWSWSFGDGQTSNIQNPIHAFPGPGGYKVNLTIKTEDGCVATTQRFVIIGDDSVTNGPQCQSLFYFRQDSTENNLIQFIDLSFGDVDTWSWNFGDGSTSDAQNPSHSYEVPGVYLVTLTTTAGICESTTQMLINIGDNIFYERTCTALFLPVIDRETNSVFLLNLSSEDAVSYLWDFGDGSSGTEFIARHQYQEAGVYEIKLTVITASGCTNTFMATIDLNRNDFTGAPQFQTTTPTKDQPFPSLTGAKLYPNPAFGNITLEWFASEANKDIIEIYSVDGRRVMSQNISNISGKNQHLIDIQHLQPGLYFIKWTGGQKTFVVTN